MNNMHTKRQGRDWNQESSRGSRSMPSLFPGFSGNLAAANAPYFGHMPNFFGDMNRMFEQVWRNFGVPAAGLSNVTMPAFQPKVDIATNSKEFLVTAELPGLDERDISLQVTHDGSLVISGEKRQETRDAQSVECTYGAFERVLPLPENVDKEGIEARFKNGVLTVICPRMEGLEQQQTRQIQVNAGGEGGQRGGSEGSREGARGSHQGGGAERGGAVHAKKAA